MNLLGYPKPIPLPYTEKRERDNKKETSFTLQDSCFSCKNIFWPFLYLVLKKNLNLSSFTSCSKQKCRLLVTHDDYSLISKLPREKTSVVTILRDPTDRVFSTYEFSIEVAARFLVHPNLTSATQMAGRIRSKTTGVSTLDIWPWKYLVPWMREDLFVRVCFVL